MSMFSNLKFLLSSLLTISLWANGSLYSQENYLLKSEHQLPEKGECLYAQYKTNLDNYYLSKQRSHGEKIESRNNNGKFELRIYVDTSYERRRTGTYNRNDSVVSILNKVIDSAKWMFNLAAPNWDIDIETDILFFDGATPFSYGANPSETLINFYDWLDANNYPGFDDNYAFYTGNYTNQGVSFLGALCFPGGSVMGYVSNFSSNVDLSSHEWIGHAANSQHYNSEVNIMNSIANRPWNAASLNVIETYLDNQNCVVNAQAPLALTFEELSLSLKKNKVNLTWSFGEPDQVEYYLIERKFQSNNWNELERVYKNQFYSDLLNRNGSYYYRVQAILKDQSRIQSLIKAISYNDPASVSIVDRQIINPEHKFIQIFDFMGRLLLQSRESTVDISKLGDFQNVLILYDQKMITCIF